MKKKILFLLIFVILLFSTVEIYTQNPHFKSIHQSGDFNPGLRWHDDSLRIDASYHVFSGKRVGSLIPFESKARIEENYRIGNVSYEKTNKQHGYRHGIAMKEFVSDIKYTPLNKVNENSLNSKFYGAKYFINHSIYKNVFLGISATALAGYRKHKIHTSNHSYLGDLLPMATMVSSAGLMYRYKNLGLGGGFLLDGFYSSDNKIVFLNLMWEMQIERTYLMFFNEFKPPYCNDLNFFVEFNKTLCFTINHQYNRYPIKTHYLGGSLLFYSVLSGLRTGFGFNLRNTSGKNSVWMSPHIQWSFPEKLPSPPKEIKKSDKEKKQKKIQRHRYDTILY